MSPSWEAENGPRFKGYVFKFVFECTDSKYWIDSDLQWGVLGSAVLTVHWKFVRNANSWALPMPYSIRNSREQPEFSL